MSNKAKKILLAVAALLIVGVAVFLIVNGSKAKYDGTITVTVQDVDKKVIAEKKIGFKAGDTLHQLVQDNFKNVKIENQMLMTIETLTTPADWSTFIAILINGEMADKGIMELPFKDGDKIDFVDTRYVPAG